MARAFNPRKSSPRAAPSPPGSAFGRPEGRLWRDYLIADGRRVGQRTRVDSNPAELRFFVTDHLGSIVSIVDTSGTSAIVEKHFSYDPWGKDRDPLTGADDPSRIYPFPPADSPTSRGFSDHEKLPGTGLINMNARLYDPEIGRFLSADSVIPVSIYYSQALNRYSYVFNNPLSLTDPDGHGFFSIFAIVAAIVSFFSDNPIVDAIASIVLAIEFGLPQSYGGAFVRGAAIAGVTSGGNVKSALIGGVQAFAFYGVGHAVKPWLKLPESGGDFGERLASAGLHGMVGGLVSDAAGGKFGTGFISAGFSDLAGSYSPFPEGLPTLAYVSVVGGVTSELGGGKFANGAVTAAFGYLYNELAESERETKRNALVEWAGDQIGSKEWSYYAPHDRVGGRSGAWFGGRYSPKCNIFVGDALAGVGIVVRDPTNPELYPSASQWGDRSIDIAGFQTLPSGTKPMPGDIIANGEHMGIFAPGPNGENMTISATTPGKGDQVVQNNWGFRGNEGPLVVRRYVGP